jgi:hypothetical protein
VLKAVAVHTAGTAQNWCQKVTVDLADSGGQAARSATVGFQIKVVGALGLTWWTYAMSKPLAAPVPAHRTVPETWTLCLADWQVPAGLHMVTTASGVSQVSATAKS